MNNFGTGSGYYHYIKSISPIHGRCPMIPVLKQSVVLVTMESAGRICIRMLDVLKWLWIRGKATATYSKRRRNSPCFYYLKYIFIRCICSVHRSPQGPEYNLPAWFPRLRNRLEPCYDKDNNITVFTLAWIIPSARVKIVSYISLITRCNRNLVHRNMCICL